MGANSSAALKNARVAAGTALMTYVALQSTAAASSAGTELTGGSPAYARKATSWSAAANGVQTTTQTHDVASGSSVASLGLFNALTVGTFHDAVTVTTQSFASQGQYTSTITDTQS